MGTLYQPTHLQIPKQTPKYSQQNYDKFIPAKNDNRQQTPNSYSGLHFNLHIQKSNNKQNSRLSRQNNKNKIQKKIINKMNPNNQERSGCMQEFQGIWNNQSDRKLIYYNMDHHHDDNINNMNTHNININISNNNKINQKSDANLYKQPKIKNKIKQQQIRRKQKASSPFLSQNTPEQPKYTQNKNHIKLGQDQFRRQQYSHICCIQNKQQIYRKLSIAQINMERTDNKNQGVKVSVVSPDQIAYNQKIRKIRSHKLLSPTSHHISTYNLANQPNHTNFQNTAHLIPKNKCYIKQSTIVLPNRNTYSPIKTYVQKQNKQVYTLCAQSKQNNINQSLQNNNMNINKNRNVNNKIGQELQLASQKSCSKLYLKQTNKDKDNTGEPGQKVRKIKYTSKSKQKQKASSVLFNQYYFGNTGDSNGCGSKIADKQTKSNCKDNANSQSSIYYPIIKNTHNNSLSMSKDNRTNSNNLAHHNSNNSPISLNIPADSHTNPINRYKLTTPNNINNNNVNINSQVWPTTSQKPKQQTLKHPTLIISPNYSLINNKQQQQNSRDKQYSICSNSDRNISKLSLKQIQSEIHIQEEDLELQSQIKANIYTNKSHNTAKNSHKNRKQIYIILDQSIIIRGNQQNNSISCVEHYPHEQVCPPKSAINSNVSKWGQSPAKINNDDNVSSANDNYYAYISKYSSKYNTDSKVNSNSNSKGDSTNSNSSSTSKPKDIPTTISTYNHVNYYNHGTKANPSIKQYTSISNSRVMC